jgi:hypothetical protein
MAKIEELLKVKDQLDPLIQFFETDEFQLNPFRPGYIYFAAFSHTLASSFRVFGCQYQKQNYQLFCNDDCKQVENRTECTGLLKYCNISTFSQDNNKRKTLNTIIGTKLRPVLILSQVNPKQRDSGNFSPNQVLVAPIKTIREKFTQNQIFLDILKSVGKDINMISEKDIIEILDYKLPYFWRVPTDIGLEKESFVDLTDIDQISTGLIAKSERFFIPKAVLSTEQFDEVQCKILDLLSYEIPENSQNPA